MASVSSISGLLLAMCITVHAASSALIVTGLAASPEDTDEFQRLAGETKRLLVERGFPQENITTLSGRVSREAVLQALQAAKPSAKDDEFWLVLYGHSATVSDEPAFQISGPRLTASDLKTALEAIPARQYVFIGTNASGSFLTPLQSANRNVLTATKGQDEDDQPRFPDEWIEAFGENPKASFARIAARAAALTEDQYKTNSLAQTEHARLADATTGTILEPPFGVDLSVKDPTAAHSNGTDDDGSVDLSKLTVKPRDPNAMWEKQPASDETRKIIAEAQKTPNPDGDAAIMLEQQIAFTVRADRMTERDVSYRVYVPREEAVADWANCFLPQSAPVVTTRLLQARLINPDGSSTVFNPAKVHESIDPNSGESSGESMIFLPDAHAGCVIEIAYRTLQMVDSTIPEVSESLPIQQSVPVLKTSLEVRVPEKPAFHVQLNGLTATPVESVENDRQVSHWDLGPIPSAAALPGDPPPQQWTVWLAVSSLPSWDHFAACYRRLARGSDVIDDSVRAMGKKLAEGAKTRMEKIQRDFEFVSALRYVAIEIGVQGFRPRTPAQVLANRYGDCKDKANLVAALLRSQGIDAHFVLLNRFSYTDVNFPSWQFNHAIAFVPAAAKDGQANDLWLDTTDSVTPFGSVPPGDYGRSGLIFSDDKVEFKTVKTDKSGVSEIRDDWTLRQDANGIWSGQVKRAGLGFADDGLRREYRGFAPVQRQARLFQAFNALWPLAEFSKVQVSDASVQGQPMQLQAEVTGDIARLPQIGDGVQLALAAPTRNRPLLLNDGQPMRFTQTITLHYDHATPKELPAPFHTEAAGEQLSVEWTRVDEHTCRRTASLDLAQGLVSTADYAALRRALHDWNTSLAR